MLGGRAIGRCLAGLFLLVSLGFAPGLNAQTVQAPLASAAGAAPILTIDPERLFNQSLYGQAIVSQVQADTESLATENRRIETDLTAEEQDLANRRAAMDPQAFRAEAEAFDAKVQDIRQAQDAKETALQSQITAGRDAFFQAARPILGELMLSLGAGLILDRRSVFLSVGGLDITDRALVAIDAAIGASIDTVPTETSGN